MTTAELELATTRATNPSTSLLKVVRSGKLKPSQLVTHHFAMNDIIEGV